MIYTVTFNPSLDYVVQADQLIREILTGQQANISIREEKETTYL